MAGAELAGSDPYLQGKPCPKCSYVRAEAGAIPKWQCPRCGIAYLKYRAPTPQLASRLAAGGRDLVVEARSDSSAFALVAANAVALAVAWATKMSLQELMLVYWIQSVIIGLTHAVRIASLADYDTDEPYRDAVPWYAQLIRPLVVGGKWGTAIAFVLLYGVLHFAYLVIVLHDLLDHGETLSGGGLALCALVFAVCHLYSLARNIRNDRRGVPNLGTLVMLPYFRIMPMHLTIFVGVHLFGGGAVLLFGALKTLADVGMHSVEHHLLRTGRVLPPAETGRTDG